MAISAFARGVSIAGHPAAVVPAALFLPLWNTASDPFFFVYFAVAISAALAVIAWSALKVRRGAWAHIDASEPEERRQLNRALLIIFMGGAGLSALFGLSFAALGFVCAGLIIGMAALFKPPFKLSHHMAFASFALCIAGSSRPDLVIAGGALILLLAWSRVYLGRHSYAEIMAGFGAGAVSGFIFMLGSAFIT